MKYTSYWNIHHAETYILLKYTLYWNKHLTEVDLNVYRKCLLNYFIHKALGKYTPHWNDIGSVMHIPLWCLFLWLNDNLHMLQYFWNVINYIHSELIKTLLICLYIRQDWQIHLQAGLPTEKDIFNFSYITCTTVTYFHN